MSAVNLEMEESGKGEKSRTREANPDGSEKAALLLDLEDRDPNRLNTKTAVRLNTKYIQGLPQ